MSRRRRQLEQRLRHRQRHRLRRVAAALRRAAAGSRRRRVRAASRAAPARIVEPTADLPRLRPGSAAVAAASAIAACSASRAKACRSRRRGGRPAGRAWRSAPGAAPPARRTRRRCPQRRCRGRRRPRLPASGGARRHRRSSGIPGTPRSAACQGAGGAVAASWSAVRRRLRDLERRHAARARTAVGQGHPAPGAVPAGQRAMVRRRSPSTRRSTRRRPAAAAARRTPCGRSISRAKPSRSCRGRHNGGRRRRRASRSRRTARSSPRSGRARRPATARPTRSSRSTRRRCRSRTGSRSPSAEFVTGPTILRHNDKDIVLAATKDGRVMLLDAASLGGANHATPLSASKTVARRRRDDRADALAAWQESVGPRQHAGRRGRRLRRAADGGRGPGSRAGRGHRREGRRRNGAISAGAVVALKLIGAGGALSLEPGWVSHNLAARAPRRSSSTAWCSRWRPGVPAAADREGRAGGAARLRRRDRQGALEQREGDDDVRVAGQLLERAGPGLRRHARRHAVRVRVPRRAARGHDAGTK